MTPGAVLLAVGLGGAVVSGEGGGAEKEGKVRAELVWIFGDDELLHAPNASSPPSPGWAIGDREAYAALGEGLLTPETGRENRLELRLGAKAPGFLDALETRAELWLRSDLTGTGQPLSVEDLASFVEVSWGASSSRLALRLFPINGDFERVGWLEALAWGGAVGPRRDSLYESAEGPVRAVRVEWRVRDTLSFSAGMKTAGFVEAVPDAPAVVETSYGGFGTVDARPESFLRLGAGAGYFEHGRLEPRPGAERAVTLGASALLSLQSGLTGPSSPIGFWTEGEPPFGDSRAAGETPKTSTKTGETSAEGARNDFGYAVAFEGTKLLQRLGKFERPESARFGSAHGGALLATLRAGWFELATGFVARDPAFVMRNVPGVFPGLTLPATAQSAWERTLLATPGFAIQPWLGVRVGLGVRWPAAVMTAALDRLGQATGSTVVVGGPGELELLPPATLPVPVFALRPAVDVRFSGLLSAAFWAEYRRDHNRARLVGAGGGLVGRGFREPDRLGFGLGVRARF